ncbi:IS3 family transposase [Mycoplasmatota bacterium zrk1]
MNELRDEFSWQLKDLLTIPCLIISKSTYHYIASNIDKKNADLELISMISEIQQENKYRYGYRRITIVLKIKYNITVNHKKVLRVMRENSLLSKKKQVKKYKSYRGTVGKIADNLLARNFMATSPNEKWCTDITEFKVCGEKIYLSPIVDLFDRSIVSYTYSKTPNVDLVVEMLKKAIKSNPIGNLTLHSDQGFHYQHKKYSKTLEKHGITQSMSRKGNCIDNSPIENFFSVLKNEFYYQEEFESIQEFLNKLDDYIHYYNNDRISLKLKGFTPIGYRYEPQFI